MQVIFIRTRHRLPGAPAEIGTVIAGFFSVLSLPEIKIVRILAFRIRQCLLEPFMLVGAMVDYQIHDDIHTPLFRLRQQLVEIRHGTKFRRNRIIIRYIIALIHKGRLVYGRKPDNVHSQFFQIVQPADHAAQIPDTVSVGIQKAFGVNLICYFIMPPFFNHNKILPYSCFLKNSMETEGFLA